MVKRDVCPDDLMPLVKAIVDAVLSAKRSVYVERRIEDNYSSVRVSFYHDEVEARWRVVHVYISKEKLSSVYVFRNDDGTYKVTVNKEEFTVKDREVVVRVEGNMTSIEFIDALR